MKIVEQEKISIVGKFTNAIVHDIKNMLNVVDIYLDLLEQKEMLERKKKQLSIKHQE